MIYIVLSVFLTLVNNLNVAGNEDDISFTDTIDNTESLDKSFSNIIAKDVDNVKNIDNLNDNDDSVADVEVDDEKKKYTDSTMYRQLYDNIELSDEERKLIKIEEEERTFKKTNAKFVSFYDIKYGSLKWKDVGDVNIVSADLFSIMQRKFYTYQNLGIDGSNVFRKKTTK